MRKLLMGLAIAVLAPAAIAEPVNAPVARSDTAPNASSAEAPSAKDKAETRATKKICRNLDAGFSHRTERVCMTAKQWEAYDRGE